MRYDSQVVQRRLDLMEAEGVTFVTNTEIGKTVSAVQLMADSDAVLLTVGSTWPRDLPIPGK